MDSDTIRQARGVVTAIAPADNAAANEFLRNLPRRAPAIHGIVADDVQQQPDAKPSVNAGSGANQTGPEVSTNDVINKLLRGQR